MRGPEAWLSENTQYGDLILTGGSDFVSKAIQRLTRGHYSHATIAIEDGHVVEAIDYVNESTGGLFGTTFSTLCTRSDVNRISVFRPIGLDEPELARAVADAQSARPSFDSAGILLLGALRGAEFAQRRLQLARPAATRAQSQRAHERLEGLVDLAGDGLHRVHCAELVTRLYAKAGLNLTFSQPTFLHLLADLDPAPARASKSTSLPRIAAFPEQRHNIAMGIASHGLRPGHQNPPDSMWLIRQIVNSAAGRRTERTRADHADFVVPSDLAKAQPFDKIGTVYLDRGKWRTKPSSTPPAGQ